MEREIGRGVVKGEKEEGESTLWTASWWSVYQMDSLVSERQSWWWQRASVTVNTEGALLFKSLIAFLSLPLSSYLYICLPQIFLRKSNICLDLLRYFRDSHADSLSSCLYSQPSFCLSDTHMLFLYSHILSSLNPRFSSLSLSYGCCFFEGSEAVHSPHCLHWSVSVY